MKSKNNLQPVTIIMPMRNASTTVVHALGSIEKQKYPVKEIIVIDNVSKDNSVEIVKNYSKKSRIPIKLIIRDVNKGVAGSFNLGAKVAKSSLVIFMHSDCSLPTDMEMEKLTKPVIENKDIVASFPTVFLLESVWRTYGFWEKCFFAREAGTGTAGLTTKFDCIRKDIYQKIGGLDERNFGVGGEDADIHDRLRAVGRVVKSDARVTHLHYLGEGYSLGKLLHKQRIYARIYGRLMRIKGKSFFSSNAVLLVKPALAILPLIPVFQALGISLLVLYAFLYTKKMFITKSTLMDYRIIFLPFFNILFLYHETFWMIESFLFGKNKIE